MIIHRSTDRPTACTLLILVVVLALTFSAAIPALAAFYRYTDADGRQVFVDDPSKIPKEYQDDTAIYVETTDQMSAEELQRLRRSEKEELAREMDEQRRRELLEEKRQTEKDRHTTPIRIENNLIYVPVTLTHMGDDVQTEFLLDTGASTIVLSKQVALDLYLFSAENGRVKGIGGSVQTERAVVDAIQVGPFRMEGMPVVIVPGEMPLPEMQGILGMSFLRHHTYRIDMKGQRILWDQKTP
jgi:predicted aspartyl protease